MSEPAVARLEFWYDLASTYSYPAAARIEALAATRGVELVWRPFLLGPIFNQQGWSDSPFNIYPAKGRYMWRDLERLCAADGLPFRRPSQFPRHSVLAARVALVGVADGWVAPFTRAVYRANFAEDRDIADPAVLDELLAGLGLDGAAVRARATAPELRARLRAQTEAAMAAGIFGAPSFVAAGELYWGNDRLEAALASAGASAGDVSRAHAPSAVEGHEG